MLDFTPTEEQTLLVDSVRAFIEKELAPHEDEVERLGFVPPEIERKVRTITLDNGTEFHDYKKVEEVHAVKFYFATPYHSWERGTNENTNGLIRQYLPKGMCLRHVTQADCDRIAAALNDRPRQRLGFRTPSEAFARS